MDKIREMFAFLIGCSDPLDIAITPNTAYAISLAAANIERSLEAKIAPGNKVRRVVLLQDQFPSAVYPWQQLCENSNGAVVLDIVPYPGTDANCGWTESILRRLDSDVVATCLPPLHWSNGAIIDLEAVSLACQKIGIPLIVDATQGTPNPTNFRVSLLLSSTVDP